jgi:hypothetical protein
MGAAVAACSTDRSKQPPEPRKAVTADPSGSSEFLKAVTSKGILEHERRFQAIAEAHGNTRAAGTPGYRESREYVAKRLRRAGYGVRVQSFKFPFFRVLAPLKMARVSPDPLAYQLREDFAPMRYSGSGDVTAELQPVDISPSPGGEPGPSTSGCEEQDFTGFDEGDIAFLQRGTCSFEEKAKNAEAAGASAALIFIKGEENKTQTIWGTLQKPGVTIPVLGTSLAVGEDLEGIPAGGLFSGAEGRKTGEQAEVYGGEAGVAYDGCYHEACDDVGNLSTKALEQLSDGAAYATYMLARDERR